MPVLGAVDAISAERVAGWVWDSSRPNDRLTVVVRSKDRALVEVDASLPRPDLQAAGIGDGRYSFDIELPSRLSDAEQHSLVVELSDGSYRLPVGEQAFQQALKDTQLNVGTIGRLRAEPPTSFGFIRFDPNLDCNLHCVYCHNHRSKELVATDDFASFLHANVLATNYFQVGCVMEPTLDPRLTELMLLVASSPARPKIDFMLQTNGILLHRHDHEKMKAAGLSTLSVSVDAAEPETQKLLRNGTSLDKVIRNVVAFRKNCPEIAVELITTVTAANVEKTENLVTLGLDIGVKKFVFREVFYHRKNNVVDHSRMPGLVLADGAFARMRQRLVDEFGGKVRLIFAENEYLSRASKKMLADSLT